MEVWNWMCCFKYNFSSIGQINESACRPLCSDVKSSSLEEKSSLKQYTSGNKCSSTKVHHWISVMIKPRLTKTSLLNLVIGCHHAWVEVHHWIVLCTCTCMAESSAVNCPVHMADLEAKVQRWIQLSGTGQQSSSLKLVVTTLGQIHRWIAGSVGSAPEPQRLTYILHVWEISHNTAVCCLASFVLKLALDVPHLRLRKMVQFIWSWNWK